MKRLFAVLLTLMLFLAAAGAEEEFFAVEEEYAFSVEEEPVWAEEETFEAQEEEMTISEEELIPEEAVEEIEAVETEPEEEPVGIEEALEETNIASGYWGSCPWEIDDNGVLTIYEGRGQSYPMPSWREYAQDILSCKSEGRVVLPQSIQGLFSSLPYCQYIDLSSADTSNVTNMSGAFRECKYLTSVNLSGWNTENVTSFASMFSQCDNIEKVDLSNWKTSNVVKMGSMFYSCDKLKSVNFSGWDTRKVTDMSSAFEGCKNLTDLDLSSWTTNSLTTTAYMFCFCEKLTDLNLSNFDTSRVTEGNAMFEFCDSLARIKVGERFTFKDRMGEIIISLPSRKIFYSKVARTWFSPQDISANRSNIADVYSTSILPIYPAPAATTGISSRPVDTNAARITWNSVKDASGYQLWRSDNGGEYKWIKNCTTNIVNNYSLTPGVDYKYKIRAYTGDSFSSTNGPFSEEVSVHILGKIENFTVTGKDTNCAFLKWDRVDGCTGYQVFRTVAGSGEYQWVKNATTPQVANYSLKPGTTYYYKIRAYIDLPGGKRAYGQYSDGVKVYIQPQVEITLRGGDKQIAISWDKADGATGYQIFYTEAGTGGEYTWWKNIPAGTLTATLTGLKAGTDYWFKVRSYVELPSGGKYYGQLSEAKHTFTK